MNARPKAGLLPLYLKLYDDCKSKGRKRLEPFLERIASGLAELGIDVATAPVCRLRSEFEGAVSALEQQGVDILVTLHLAYSPSLESIGALTGTSLPILILDTTPDEDFGAGVDPALIMFNHGIHGVQDLASMLRRNGRSYEIVAGHWQGSDVLARAADIIRAAHAAKRFRSTRALRIGEAFQGMGDFSVPEDMLKGALGITVTQMGSADLQPFVEGVAGEAVEAELARDREQYVVEVEETVHERSVRLGLGVRALLEKESFGAFSANFLAFDSADGPVNTVPFLEISKAMSRGIGYAGEGDVLTASLVGALLSGWERTTFTEIFCPDWKGDALFLSHMGEINPAVAAAKPLISEKPFPFAAALNPAILTCAPEQGPAVFVNLTPGPEDSFRLIVAPVEVLGEATHPKMKNVVRGWIRSPLGVAPFLEAFSRAGGTHHSALVLGEHAEAIQAMARFAGLECCRVG